MMQVRVSLSIFFIAWLLLACGDDAADLPLPNGCGYTYYEGTCRGEPEGMFHFFGIIDGRLASFPGNEIERRDVVLEEGETMACWLLWTPKRKACTPCVFDIGQCGESAWAGYRNFR